MSRILLTDGKTEIAGHDRSWEFGEWLAAAIRLVRAFITTSYDGPCLRTLGGCAVHR
jgi:hypothetical protein